MIWDEQAPRSHTLFQRIVFSLSESMIALIKTMNYQIPFLALTCLMPSAYGVVTMSNISLPGSGFESLLDPTSGAFETVTVEQTFTVGDAQAGLSTYDFESLSFNVNLSAEPFPDSSFVATLTGVGLSGVSQDFQLDPNGGFETLTFPGSPGLQLTGGETYTLTLTMQRSADQPDATLSALYTEDINQTTTGNNGETISGPWNIGNTSSNGGLFAGGATPLVMDVNLSSAPIPEPSSALLAGLGVLALIQRRRY